MQKHGILTPEQVAEKQRKYLELRDSYEKRVAKRVSQAAANGIRFTFNTKPVKGEVPLVAALRRQYQ